MPRRTDGLFHAQFKGKKKKMETNKTGWSSKGPNVWQTARDNHWSPDSQTIKAFVQSPTAFLFIHTCSKVLRTMLKLASPAQSAGSILKYLSIFSETGAKRRKAQDVFSQRRYSFRRRILCYWYKKFHGFCSSVVTRYLSLFPPVPYSDRFLFDTPLFLSLSSWNLPLHALMPSILTGHFKCSANCI